MIVKTSSLYVYVYVYVRLRVDLGREKQGNDFIREKISLHGDQFAQLRAYFEDCVWAPNIPGMYQNSVFLRLINFNSDGTGWNFSSFQKDFDKRKQRI